MSFPKFPKALTALMAHPSAMHWLENVYAQEGANNTILTYGYALLDYIRFSQKQKVNHITATTKHAANYAIDLRNRPIIKNDISVQCGLSKSSRRQRLTVICLYYNYLVREGVRKDTPFRHAASSIKKKHGMARRNPISVQHTENEAWTPDDAQWNLILDSMKGESLRNKVMLALCYECALRKGELCQLKISDVQGNVITLRPETTKTNRTEKVKFSDSTRRLLDRYLATRPVEARHDSNALFLSESTKNWAQPITDSTWTKVIKAVAERAQLPHFTPHTLRHLGITHFAAQGWERYKVSNFARHRSWDSTMRYMHLTPEALDNEVEKALAKIVASQRD